MPRGLFWGGKCQQDPRPPKGWVRYVLGFSLENWISRGSNAWGWGLTVQSWGILEDEDKESCLWDLIPENFQQTNQMQDKQLSHQIAKIHVKRARSQLLSRSWVLKNSENQLQAQGIWRPLSQKWKNRERTVRENSWSHFNVPHRITKAT